MPADRERADPGGEPLRGRLERVAGTGSYEWDVRSGAVTWSPQLYRVLGRDPAAGPLPVADLPGLVDPADVAAGARAAGWLMEYGRTVDVTCPVRIRGRVRHVRAVAEPVHDAEGRLVAVRGVVKDVTVPPNPPDRLGPVECRWRPAPDDLDDRTVHRMAARLQAMAVPARLPPVTLAGMRVEGRYIPAAQPPRAGGDWFHTAVLGDGRVLLAVGDVAGHGLPAAATMANLRARLTTLSADTSDPVRLATDLNRVLLDCGEDRTASALLACWDPIRAELTWTQAGHPAPLLRRRGRTGRLRRPAGMLLGSDPAARYEAATAALGTGDVLMLYTDGLLATPDGHPDTSRDLRLRRIARALRDLPSEPGEAALPWLMDRLPPMDPGDDACVLLAYPVERAAPTPAPDTAAPLLSRDFDLTTLDTTRDAVQAQGARAGLTDLALFNFTLAVTEVVTNAVRHGGAHGRLVLWREGDHLLVEVADHGGGIPPARRTPHGPRPGQVGGWGLWLARQICTSVEIDSGPAGTRVRLRYPVPAPVAQP